MKTITLFLSVLAASAWGAAEVGVPVVLAKDDTVLFYGSGMVERLLESGQMEAYLQLAHPDKNLHVRSLAWTGDEVGWRARPEGYVEHLTMMLAKWPAKVVVLSYGMNESFAGPVGLAEFRAEYGGYLREIARLHPQAKLVLLSPMAVEGDEWAAKRNAEVAAYAGVISEVAKAHQAAFVDLFAASKEAYAKSPMPLTALGIHLNEVGCRAMGKVIARALVGDAGLDQVNTARVDEVAKAAGQKSRYVADVVRPKNGVVYFGVRKRPQEYAAEMPRYHQLIDQADKILHELVNHPQAQFADFPPPSLPELTVGKSVPDRFSGGVMKAPVEQQSDLKVAVGYTLNLFASEEQFPDLKNPVQMAFDARGRLWVVTMPSFPHTIPGEQAHDKILILEDTDRDGKADKSTVFADGFDALDGVAFHEQGVIVSAQPRLLILKDTNGDDRADTQTELLRGVDVTDSHHGGMIATDPLGHVIFSDGVFHRSQFETPFGVVRGIDATTYRLHPGTGRIETEWQGMTPNPWKVAFDGYGQLFQRFGGGHVLDGLAQVWTPLGVYHPYGNGTVVNYGKGSALGVIASPNFPDEYQQGVATATLLGTYIVSLSKPSADGGGMVGADRLDLITSANSAFRPVDCEFGFDGALYVSDFASRIIGHAQHPMRDPQWNHTLGRIWRVVSNAKDLVKDYPQIEGAGVSQLIALLEHPQNIVRHHARIQLRAKGGTEVVAALDEAKLATEQGKLEVLWVLHALGQVRPVGLGALLQSRNVMFRVAAVQLLRFQASQIPAALVMLTTAARDPHPRVRMAVMNTVSHLRANGQFQFERALTNILTVEPSVKQLWDGLKVGTTPARGRSVPVLNVAPESVVKLWLPVETAPAELNANPPANPTAAAGKKRVAAVAQPKTYRTFIHAEAAQTALVSVKHGYLDISANDVQLLSADSSFTTEQQVQIELQKGLNQIEITFRKVKADPPPVFIYDPLGQVLAKAHFPKDEAALSAQASQWDQEHADGALHVQAVPNQMQFSPRELRVLAGHSVKIVFTNPDLMPHNLVLIAPGSEEEVGMLADQMATKPDSLAKGFIPESPKILHATKLVEATGKAELSFTAPTEPGSYPFICTFPGHWRVMRGVMNVK